KNALPLLAKYGFKATFYINPGRTNFNPETWRTAYDEGHELGNHTMRHTDTVGAEALANEVGEASKAIQEITGTPIFGPFAVPGGVKWEVSETDFSRVLAANNQFFPGRKDFYQDGEGDILRFPKAALLN